MTVPNPRLDIPVSRPGLALALATSATNTTELPYGGPRQSSIFHDLTLFSQLYYALILFRFELQTLVGLVKFGELIGYQTWSVNAAFFSTFFG